MQLHDSKHRKILENTHKKTGIIHTHKLSCFQPFTPIPPPSSGVQPTHKRTTRPRGPTATRAQCAPPGWAGGQGRSSAGVRPEAGCAPQEYILWFALEKKRPCSCCSFHLLNIHTHRKDPTISVTPPTRTLQGVFLWYSKGNTGATWWRSENLLSGCPLALPPAQQIEYEYSLEVRKKRRFRGSSVG